jgi:AcrR family transcriptional regulator
MAVRGAGSTQADTAAQVREQIIEAAEARYAHYGFNKTSLAEMARDCGMSTTNLYRYFDSKDAIGAEIVSRFLARVEKRLCEIADEQDTTSAGRLEAMVLARLEMILGQIESSPHLRELIDYICAKEAVLIAQHIERTREAFARVIARGTKTGEFEVEDPATAAEAVVTATVNFYHPVLVSECADTDLEGSARKVLALLINGLKRSGGGRR